jgi:hypothetical protein
VLLLSTVYEGTEFTARIRKRPTTTHTRARAIKQFFGPEAVKEARVLTAAADYNDHMGAVDRGDQLRQQEGLDHRVIKGPWRALAWGFLLETALTNTFLLQKHGQPNWKPFRTLHEWREQISHDLLSQYGQKASLRQRNHTGDINTPVLQHIRVRRKSPGRCAACRGVHWHEPTKTAFKEVSGNRRVPQSRSGCQQCNVPLCNSDRCWYFYHRLN